MPKVLPGTCSTCIFIRNCSSQTNFPKKRGILKKGITLLSKKKLHKEYPIITNDSTGVKASVCSNNSTIHNTQQRTQHSR